MGNLQTNKKRLCLEGESIILKQNEIGIGSHLIVFKLVNKYLTSTDNNSKRNDEPFSYN